MSEAFLIASCIGLAFVLNAWWPIPFAAFSLPSFFGGWLTMELAPQLLVIHVIVSSSLAATGALDGFQGWAALGIAVLIAVGLVGLIIQEHRARDIVEDALKENLGPDYLSKIPPQRATSYDLRVPWRELLLPFHMSHPNVRRIRDLPYGPGGRANFLDVYQNKSEPAEAPAMIYVHGGAWTIGKKEWDGQPLLLHLAARGWVCFSINYRLSPRATFPDQLVDVKRAIAWVRENGARYGADTRYIAIAGGSAGGHLGSLAALTQNEPEYQPGFEEADTSIFACCSHYGVYDFTDDRTLSTKGRLRMLERAVMKKRMRNDREPFEKASPLYRVRPDAPAFFVVHGHHDSLVPVTEARQFTATLRAISQSAVVYAELPGAQHAFDVFPSIRTAHVLRAIERFLDYVLAQPAALPTKSAEA